MGKRVVVDFDLCQSNAVCMGIAPEVFEVRDDGFLYVLDEHPADELLGRGRNDVDGRVRTGVHPVPADKQRIASNHGGHRQPWPARSAWPASQRMRIV